MNKLCYEIPFWGSIIVFLVALGMAVYWFLKPRVLKTKSVFEVTTNTGKHLMMFSLVFLLSVWMLRFSIGNWCFIHRDVLKEIPKMGPWRQVFNSFLHALQTFSMDETYTAYLENGMKMGLSILHDHLRPLLMLYLSSVNIIAPIAGGAFVFEVLAGIFPQVKYTLSRGAWYKDRFYFTSLNESSLALAKSIVSDSQYKHALLVFTDAYADDENEESSELLLSAKALGAICLKDDLLHIPLKCLIKRKRRKYIFLSDQEEIENLQTLAQLLRPERQKDLLDTEISVFGTDKKTSNIEDEVIFLHNRLSAEYEENNVAILPDIAPVNGIRNMAQKLFYEIPLFEGLYEKEGREQQINLTIIGSGAIGTELFLNAYWFGQIAGVELNISVISANETREEFIARMDGINPDIMATSRVGDRVLDVRIKDSSGTHFVPQPRYFGFRYEQYDMVDCDLVRFLKTEIGEDGFRLQDTDYFIVAVGSDEENFLIADKLRQAIGYYHLNEEENKKTIIGYVIYNSDLCRTLNTRPRYKHVSNLPANEFDIYMHAFGSMEEIYSVNNILRNDIRERTATIGQNYKKKQSENSSTRSNQIKTRQYYNKRADAARGLHLRYKAFSAGLLTPSLFKTGTDEAYRQELIAAEKSYINHVSSVWSYPKYAANANSLAWMEHRRWNAYMRMNGFKKPESVDRYISLDSDIHSLKPGHDKAYQFLSIKRHPCIVECDINGYPGVNSKQINKIAGSLIGPDELDDLYKSLGTDYKEYDYPEYDIPSDQN